MSKKIIIDLIEDYSTIETELVKLRDKGTEYLDIVTQLLQSSNAESIQPIETFLTAVKNIADNIFNKGFVKEKALIVDRITNSKEAFIVLNKSTQIDELIKNPDKKKQLTTGEINRITEMLDELNVLFSSLIQKINCFLRFMTINKLDTYTQNDTTLNNALIQALKIKDKKKRS